MAKDLAILGPEVMKKATFFFGLFLGIFLGLLICDGGCFGNGIMAIATTSFQQSPDASLAITAMPLWPWRFSHGTVADA